MVGQNLVKKVCLPQKREAVTVLRSIIFYTELWIKETITLLKENPQRSKEVPRLIKACGSRIFVHEPAWVGHENFYKDLKPWQVFIKLHQKTECRIKRNSENYHISCFPADRMPYGKFHNITTSFLTVNFPNFCPSSTVWKASLKPYFFY